MDSFDKSIHTMHLISSSNLSRLLTLKNLTQLTRQNNKYQIHVQTDYLGIKSISNHNKHEMYIVLVRQFKDNDLKLVLFNTLQVH